MPSRGSVISSNRPTATPRRLAGLPEASGLGRLGLICSGARAVLVGLDNAAALVDWDEPQPARPAASARPISVRRMRSG